MCIFICVGIDIIHFPSIIFLDEPTSGLDSNTALSIIDSLQYIAQAMNCTILLTIHQPSSKIFSLINKVLFLSEGKITYYGNNNIDLSLYIKEVYQLTNIKQDLVEANLPEIWLDICDQLIEMNEIDILTLKYHNNISNKLLTNNI